MLLFEPFGVGRLLSTQKMIEVFFHFQTWPFTFQQGSWNTSPGRSTPPQNTPSVQQSNVACNVDMFNNNCYERNNHFVNNENYYDPINRDNPYNRQTYSDSILHLGWFKIRIIRITCVTRSCFFHSWKRRAFGRHFFRKWSHKGSFDECLCLVKITDRQWYRVTLCAYIRHLLLDSSFLLFYECINGKCASLKNVFEMNNVSKLCWIISKNLKFYINIFYIM